MALAAVSLKTKCSAFLLDQFGLHISTGVFSVLLHNNAANCVLEDPCARNPTNTTEAIRHLNADLKHDEEKKSFFHYMETISILYT